MATYVFDGDFDGTPFPAQKISSIAIRGGNRVDAIIINDTRYGGGGGAQSDTLTLREGEYINCMVVRSGMDVDRIDIYTSHGRHIGAGGAGGAEYIVTGRVLTIAGRSDSRLRGMTVEAVADDSHRIEHFGDVDDLQFAENAIQSIALRCGSLVDAIIINGTRFGGSGGGLTSTLTLDAGEFISRVVVRHDNTTTHRLEFYTNLGRSLAGGGQGGSSTTIDGKMVAIGGRYDGFLKGLSLRFDRQQAFTYGTMSTTTLAPKVIKSIALRAGAHIDALVINGTTYGGAGGGLSQTLTLGAGEYIDRMVVRADGALIYKLTLSTNNGQTLSGGGEGGTESILEGRILTLGGAYSNRLDGLAVTVAPEPMQVAGYGRSAGGAPFAMRPFSAVALQVDRRIVEGYRGDPDTDYSRVDALILDGTRYGGTDGYQTGTMTLAAGEYIDHVKVRHGNKIDRLEMSTNKQQTLSGGGPGGALEIFKGRIAAFGGRAGGAVDHLQIMGYRRGIDNAPSLPKVGSSTHAAVRTYTFDKNGFPLDYHSLFGHRWQHLQDMIRLPDANGNQYYMGTYSQNCSDDEGAWSSSPSASGGRPAGG